MTFNTFNSGVNTSFSSELNTNFNILQRGMAQQVNGFSRLPLYAGEAYWSDPNSFSLFSFAIDTSNTSAAGIVTASGGFSMASSTIPVGQTVSSVYLYFDYGLSDQCDEAVYSAGTSSSISSTDLSNKFLVTFNYQVIDSTSFTGAQVILTDGTNDVTLFSANSGGREEGICQMNIDWTNKRIVYTKYYRLLGKDSAGDVNSITQQQATGSLSISSLSSALKFKLSAGAGASASVSKIRGFKLSPSSTVNCKVSSDGGSNYTTLSSNPDITTISTASSNLKFRVDGTLASSTEVFELKSVFCKILG